MSKVQLFLLLLVHSKMGLEALSGTVCSSQLIQSPCSSSAAPDLSQGEPGLLKDLQQLFCWQVGLEEASGPKARGWHPR